MLMATNYKQPTTDTTNQTHVARPPTDASSPAPGTVARPPSYSPWGSSDMGDMYKPRLQNPMASPTNAPSPTQYKPLGVEVNGEPRLQQQRGMSSTGYQVGQSPAPQDREIEPVPQSGPVTLPDGSTGYTPDGTTDFLNKGKLGGLTYDQYQSKDTGTWSAKPLEEQLQGARDGTWLNNGLKEFFDLRHDTNLPDATRQEIAKAYAHRLGMPYNDPVQPIYQPPTNGMGADGGPKPGGNTSNPEYTGPVGGNEPGAGPGNTDFAGTDWGSNGGNLADAVSGYEGYVPGSSNGYQPSGEDPNFQGHPGTDIPQHLAVPGSAAGPGHTFNGQNMPGTAGVNIRETGLMNSGEHSAITREVQDDETVAGQLEGLLSSENPLVKQARLRAEQEAASRGLNNSTMALQSGEQAAFSSMMPVAQQDAATYANQGLTNQEYENEFAGRDQAGDIEAGLLGRKGKIDAELNKQSGEIESELTAQQGNISAGLQDDAYRYDSSLQDQNFREQSNLSYQDYAEEAELNKKAYQNQFELNEQQYGFEHALQELKNQALVDTAAIEAENKVLIQTNAGAAQIYSQYMDSVSSLYESAAAEGADTSRLTAGLADLQRGLQENLEVLSSFVSLDLSSYGGDSGQPEGDGPPPGWPEDQPWPPEIPNQYAGGRYQ